MSVKKICINGIGIALFVVMTLCLQVPVFENYYLCLGYVAMAFYTYYFGTTSGVLVGTLGVFLYCLLTGGLRGMPGWILGNVVIGIICGWIPIANLVALGIIIRTVSKEVKVENEKLILNENRKQYQICRTKYHLPRPCLNIGYTS